MLLRGVAEAARGRLRLQPLVRLCVAPAPCLRDARRVRRRAASAAGVEAGAAAQCSRQCLLETRLVVRRLYQKLLRAQQLLLFAAPVEEGGGEDADDQLFATVARAEAAQQLAAGLQTALAQLRERDLAPLFGDEASAAAASGVLQRRVEADYDALAAFAAAQLASLPVRMSLEEAKAAAAEAAARREGLRDGASTRVKAELELLREQPLEVLQDVASYSREVWARLNGRASSAGVTPALLGLPPPPPAQSRPAREARLVALSLAVEAADAELTEASRERESRLKRRDAASRLPLAREVRELDAAVRDARTVLAVRTLQLEAERCFGALEEETADVGDAAAPQRDAGLAVFVAEFGSLDASLARAVALVDRAETALLDDEEVDSLVRDVAELKSRLGLGDEDGSLTLGLLMEKCGRSARDAGSKVTEGAEFLLRGVRLLGEDVSGSLLLFSRTLSGSTLKPREVQTLRRTSRDVLTFIPFIAVLIAPITPVGHVMVFSFLQRYFPGFFPSQFTARRQELFAKWEELRAQLAAAEEEAGAATESAALREAKDVVASLTRGGGGAAEEDGRVRELQKREAAQRRAALGALAEEQEQRR